MSFSPIDLATWDRSPYYRHYTQEVPCTYTVNVRMDISALRGERLYPAMLWLLTSTINEMPQFRTALEDEQVGVYDQMHPSYTVFNPERETFSVLWTEFQPQYQAFLQAYLQDIAQYTGAKEMCPKAGRPGNTFDVSMIPWLPFTGFELHLPQGNDYLLPIFTLGKYTEEGDRRWLPVSIRVHHAVCDGYHVSKFVERLQEKIFQFSENRDAT